MSRDSDEAKKRTQESVGKELSQEPMSVEERESFIPGGKSGINVRPWDELGENKPEDSEDGEGNDSGSQPDDKKQENNAKKDGAKEDGGDEDILGTLPKITLGIGVLLTVMVVGYLWLHGLKPPQFEPKWFVHGGDPNRGKAAIKRYGCGSCHVVDGIPKASGRVGPQLTTFNEQQYIAGQVTNTPENLILWLMDPQRVEPGTAMPDLSVSDQDARDMASYLYQIP